MLFAPFGWLGRNIRSMLLALVLAVVVWIAAVVAADPNEEHVYENPVEIEIIGQKSSLVQVKRIPTHTSLTLNAPKSIWDRLNSNPGLIHAWVDLSGLEPGEHNLDVKIQVALSPHRIVKVEPEEIEIKLEKYVTRQFPIQISVTGDPALGYGKGDLVVDPKVVTISGQESIIDQVTEVWASLDIAGARETVKRQLAVQVLDENNERVAGITLVPQTVSATQPINLLGGYRNAVVKVITSGVVAEGYWLTNLFVSPPNVTIFSTDPRSVNQMPGYVETFPIDINEANDDFDTRAALNLPDGVTLVGEEGVLVRVGIASIEGNLKMSLPLEVVGLSPELVAEYYPDTVDVLFFGPLPILNNIKPASIRISIDLTGLEPGSHQVPAVVDLLPSQVNVETIEPETVEVLIELAPTPTPTPTFDEFATPGSTGTPVATPTPSATETPQP